MIGLTPKEVQALVSRGVIQATPAQPAKRIKITAAYHRKWRQKRGAKPRHSEEWYKKNRGAKPRRQWPQLKGLVGREYHTAYMQLRRKLDGVWTRND